MIKTIIGILFSPIAILFILTVWTLGKITDYIQFVIKRRKDRLLGKHIARQWNNFRK